MTVGSITWDVARVGGLMAYVLTAASVVVGILLSLKWRSDSWPRFVTNELHRFVTLVGLLFVGIHTLAVAVDPFIGFTPLEVVVPFVSHYRPLWVALGIVAAYLGIAIYLSERVRSRIGYEWWRRFHSLAFAVFVLATLHGLGTGSDSKAPWAIAMYAGCGLLVVGLLALRMLPSKGNAGHPVVAAVVVLLTVEIVLWAATGPLRTGWNAVANDGNGSGAATTAPPGGTGDGGGATFP
jgi:predicted ferric reductase